MTDEQREELFVLATTEYAALRARGVGNKDAKRIVYEQLPEFEAEVNSNDRRMSGKWGRRVQQIDTAAASNGNGSHAPAPVSSNDNGKARAIVNPGGKVRVKDNMLVGLEACNFKPGDVLNLGDLRFWAAFLDCTEKAFTGQIRGQSTQSGLKDAGYEFEVINSTPFRARVVAVPMSETDRKIAELERQQAELGRQLAELKAGR